MEKLHKFSRLEKLIGEDNLISLNKKSVLILGVGGVGGYVAESLARSGIGTLILVDFDTIDETNINRQIIALESTIGLKKVDVLEKRIKDINGDINVIKIDKFIDSENFTVLFENKIDFFVDACDTVSTKKSVIKYCLDNNINFITSMGTGNKLNPMELEVVDISKTSVCPLAKVMRKELKDRGIKDVKVVYSKEQPIIPKFSLEEVDPVAKRRGTPGSTAFVPSVAGLIIASEVIKDLIA